MSDETDRATLAAAKAHDDPFAPFATLYDNSTVADTDNAGTAQALAAGFANRLAGAAAVAVITGTIPTAMVVVAMVTKSDADSRTTDIDAAANFGICGSAGC